MTAVQLLAIVGAIWVAPHMPAWYGVPVGLLLALASSLLLVAELVK